MTVTPQMIEHAMPVAFLMLVVVCLAVIACSRLGGDPWEDRPDAWW